MGLYCDLDRRGKGKDRKDCMKQFRAAWERFPPGGADPCAFKYFDCDRQDPLESLSVRRWLEGELGRGLFVRPVIGC